MIRRVLRRKYALAVALAFIGPICRAEQMDVPVVAVGDFESGVDRMPQLGTQFTEMLVARLSADRRVALVKRRDLVVALLSRHLGPYNDISVPGASIVQAMSGATVLIAGRVFSVTDRTVAMAKVSGLETGSISGEMVEQGTLQPLADLANQLEDKIAADAVAEKGLLIKSSNTEPVPVASGEYKGVSMPIYNWGEASPHRVFGRMYPVGSPGNGIIVAVVDESGNFVAEALARGVGVYADRFVISSYMTLEKWKFRRMTKGGRATPYIVAVPVEVLPSYHEGDSWTPGQPEIDPSFLQIQGGGSKGKSR